MKRWIPVLSVFIPALLLLAGTAMANGTVTATFLYTDSGGAVHPLDHAYVYLQSGTKVNPKEKYFSTPLLILGPTNASGYVSVSVPEGKYYVRLTRRAPLTGTPAQAQSYGPPRAGDYTWNWGTPTAPEITVTTGSVFNLGTVYATIFGEHITISGRVFNVSTGAAKAGWFVKATTQYCVALDSGYCNSIEAGGRCAGLHWSPTANCGTKYPAQKLTDSNGNYTIFLKNPGTYYILACQTPNGCSYGGYGTGSNGQIVTLSVGAGQQLTNVNISGYF